MNIQNAMTQIEVIHSHMAKTEVFRGYKALPVFIAGVIAFVSAYVQSVSKTPIPPSHFVLQWVGIAAGIVVLTAASIVVEYVIQGDAFEKRQVYVVFSQFAPSLIIGFLVTMIFIRYRIPALNLLPGFWAILFSMGIFAMRPYLPRFIGYVGLYYLVAGCVLLRMAPMHTSLTPWAMGITFGTGHIIASYILCLDKERGEDEKL